MSRWGPSDEYLAELGQRVVADSAGAAFEFKIEFGELTVLSEAGRIVELLTTLRDHPAFRFHQMILLSGADYPHRAQRFDVVYHLLSLTHNHRIRVTVRTDEDTPVPSVTSAYPVADWYEREAFDMYGIFFSGHPDLRRILTDYGFHGYPLRKDFPMTGYVEVRYDDEAKRVVYEPVKATEWRDWDFLSPWEGAEYARPGEGYPYKLPGDEKAAGPDEGKKP
jgi:NADH-quinone oxidoreductase subunit C